MLRLAAVLPHVLHVKNGRSIASYLTCWNWRQYCLMFYMLRLAACLSYYISIASCFTCWDWRPVCPITSLLPNVWHAEIGGLFVLLHLYCLMFYMLRLAACLPITSLLPHVLHAEIGGLFVLLHLYCLMFYMLRLAACLSYYISIASCFTCWDWRPVCPITSLLPHVLHAEIGGLFVLLHLYCLMFYMLRLAACLSYYISIASCFTCWDWRPVCPITSLLPHVLHAEIGGLFVLLHLYCLMFDMLRLAACLSYYISIASCFTCWDWRPVCPITSLLPHVLHDEIGGLFVLLHLYCLMFYMLRLAACLSYYISIASCFTCWDWRPACPITSLLPHVLHAEIGGLFVLLHLYCLMFYMLRLAACLSYYISIASCLTCWDWRPVCPIISLLPHVLHAEIGSLFVLLHLYCLMFDMLRLVACLSYYSSIASCFTCWDWRPVCPITSLLPHVLHAEIGGLFVLLHLYCLMFYMLRLAACLSYYISIASCFTCWDWRPVCPITSLLPHVLHAEIGGLFVLLHLYCLMFYMLRLAACLSYYISIASCFTCWDWRPVCPITSLLPHVLHAEIGGLFVLLHLYCLMFYMLRLAACLSYYSSIASCFTCWDWRPVCPITSLLPNVWHAEIGGLFVLLHLYCLMFYMLRLAACLSYYISIASCFTCWDWQPVCPITSLLPNVWHAEIGGLFVLL